jgi:hypothetical protein
MINHYVYEIWYPNGMKYIGVRSCKTAIEDDYNYKSSSKVIPSRMKEFGFKLILATFKTKEEALAEEIRLHKLFNVKDNPNFYNQANQTSTKFHISKESHAKTTQKLKGRTAENCEYIRRANEKRRQYRGDKQTPAQKAGNKRMGEWNKGRANPKKAKKGIENGGFKPWFYITPNNDYVEVTTKTKQELASKFNVTFRQLINRFHHTNINKRASLTDGRIPEGLRGYVFGNLETGED